MEARGCSSAGRAPALQAGGQEFDPPQLHHGSTSLTISFLEIKGEMGTLNVLSEVE